MSYHRHGAAGNVYRQDVCGRRIRIRQSQCIASQRLHRPGLQLSETSHGCSDLDLDEYCLCQVQLPLFVQKAHQPATLHGRLLVVRRDLQRHHLHLWRHRVRSGMSILWFTSISYVEDDRKNTDELLTLFSVQCVFGAGLERALAYSISQMVLDIVGDILSKEFLVQIDFRLELILKLVILIPIRIIWSVKIRWNQKLALTSTLCLTVLTILCTVIRMAGIHTGGHIKSMDSVWETYWQFVAANVSLTMTAATAFRTFFVSRAERDHNQGSYGSWYSRGRRMLRYVLVAPFSWTRSRTRSKEMRSSSDRASSGQYEETPWELRQTIPSATMTGVRTYIGGSGKTKGGQSQVMHSVVEEHPDDYLLPGPGSRTGLDRSGAMV